MHAVAGPAGRDVGACVHDLADLPASLQRLDVEREVGGHAGPAWLRLRSLWVVIGVVVGVQRRDGAPVARVRAVEERLREFRALHRSPPRVTRIRGVRGARANGSRGIVSDAARGAGRARRGFAGAPPAAAGSTRPPAAGSRNPPSRRSAGDARGGSRAARESRPGGMVVSCTQRSPRTAGSGLTSPHRLRRVSGCSPAGRARQRQPHGAVDRRHFARGPD